MPHGSSSPTGTAPAALHLAAEGTTVPNHHNSSRVSTTTAVAPTNSTPMEASSTAAADSACTVTVGQGLATASGQSSASAAQAHTRVLPQSQNGDGGPEAAPLADTPLGLMQQFMGLHHERARHYARLHLGQCSIQARAVQAELRSRQREDLAAYVEEIQGHERTKLQLAEGVGPLGSPAVLAGQSHPDEDEADPLEPGSARTHHHHHHHHHACSGGAPCEPPPPEPTAEEYSNALHENIQQLDRCVASINDYLEEIKYAIDDLKEER
eukprot:CAMPEP_0202355388 /NCGR_PEP_ID=MMETSP1126-20121109/10306_1 /ASSEMBLY_ACC=CAM_ASM_000457 /TAXON_ID=3047 /ORGANISM="Dunaliella tertiolecta, Strain CCMP1320" /LENGTH=267 /DNA_ID=CAMNT_0048948001 /DNA_START=269 /DNA_END=1073 /DNA_ORIENTATION=+